MNAEWGQKEHDARLSDLAEFHSGKISLEEAQRRAHSRRRDAGLSVHDVQTAMYQARIKRTR